MAALQCLRKAWLNMQEDPPDGITAGPVNGNLFHWEGTMVGPSDTPFQSGIFVLDIQFPSGYPFEPPKCTFRTKIFHPNIYPNGNICADIFEHHWTPGLLRVQTILLSIQSLLDDPNVEESANPEAALYYKEDRDKYNSIVRDYTKKYAM